MLEKDMLGGELEKGYSAGWLIPLAIQKRVGFLIQQSCNFKAFSMDKFSLPACKLRN